MGAFQSKRKRKHCEKYINRLSERIRLLQGEMNEMVCEREKETRSYEGEIVVFAFKEAEWKKERRRLQEEVKRLRKTVEEKEDMIQRTVAADEKICRCNCEEAEERAWALEKWKRLYMAIKAELDELIHRTHRDGLYWRTEERENLLEVLRKENEAKEETIEELKAKIGAMEQYGFKKETEVDILRQSLRIMMSSTSCCSTNKTTTPHHFTNKENTILQCFKSPRSKTLGRGRKVML